MTELSYTDRRFVENLARKIVSQHAPFTTQEALSADIAEAITVCLLAKGYRPNNTGLTPFSLIERMRPLWR